MLSIVVNRMSPFSYLRTQAGTPAFTSHLNPSGQGQVKQFPVQAKR